MNNEVRNEVRCAALLFDLDGVLINSTPAVTRVWRRWAIAHGFDPAKIVSLAHGRPSRATIAELLPGADVAQEDRLVEQMEIDDLEGVIAWPGAQQLLQNLPPDRWTIATSCTRQLALVRLNAAGLPVPLTMVTASDVRIGKPDPEPYLKAAANLGFSASDCIVVEDVPAGIRAGKAASARVIAFTTTVERGELEGANPDWVVASCAKIAVRLESDGLLLSLMM